MPIESTCIYVHMYSATSLDQNSVEEDLYFFISGRSNKNTILCLIYRNLCKLMNNNNFLQGR